MTHATPTLVYRSERSFPGHKVNKTVDAPSEQKTDPGNLPNQGRDFASKQCRT